MFFRPNSSAFLLVYFTDSKAIIDRAVAALCDRADEDGYIKRELSEVERQKKLEDKRIPEDIDYSAILGLKQESAEKLAKIRPKSIGQASRISGVNPADISVLLIYLGK